MRKTKKENTAPQAPVRPSVPEDMLIGSSENLRLPFNAHRTGHFVNARRLLLATGDYSKDLMATLSDGQLEELIEEAYYCFSNDKDADDIYLLPKEHVGLLRVIRRRIPS